MLYRWQIGLTKVLYNESVHTAIETERMFVRRKSAIKIQSGERMRVKRKIYIVRRDVHRRLLEVFIIIIIIIILFGGGLWGWWEPEALLAA